MRQGLRPKSFWSYEIRERIANQVAQIKHWQIMPSGNQYFNAPDTPATWFIDPPYNNKAGRAYKHSSKFIDYTNLSDWCRKREGQVMVCENEGANWLPFKPFISIKANESKTGGKISKESLWTNFTFSSTLEQFLLAG
jgi:16S rRNA G966 N2-methylase RsmD